MTENKSDKVVSLQFHRALPTLLPLSATIEHASEADGCSRGACDFRISIRLRQMTPPNCVNFGNSSDYSVSRREAWTVTGIPGNRRDQRDPQDQREPCGARSLA